MAGDESLVASGHDIADAPHTAPGDPVVLVIGSERASVQIGEQARGYQELFAGWPRYPPSVGWGIIYDERAGCREPGVTGCWAGR